jgi:lipid-binding SYLF domain-containing protein
MKMNAHCSPRLRTLLLLIGSSCISFSSSLAIPMQQQAPRAEAKARLRDQTAHEKIDARATLRKATELYSAMVKGVQGQVPESVLAKAQCVAVIPEISTGALVVGGSHGVGVASCRANNAWSTPAFLRLNAISFGAQVGAKTSDVILFILSDAAKAALVRGKFELGSDVSVSAGTFDRSVDTEKSGMVAYSRTEGVFAGASLYGGNILSADEDTAAFYGRDHSFAALLEGKNRVEQNTEADAFVALLPR